MGVVSNITSGGGMTLQTAVRTLGASTATLVVPSGQIFKGQMMGSGSITNGTAFQLVLKDTNNSGNIIGGSDENFGAATISTDIYLSEYIELSAGTYFLTTDYDGASVASQLVSFIGGHYA